MMWNVVEGEVSALTTGERPPAPPGKRSGAVTPLGKVCRGSGVEGSGCVTVRSLRRAEGVALAWSPWRVEVRAS